MSNQYEQRTKKGKGCRKKNLRKKLEKLRENIWDVINERLYK